METVRGASLDIVPVKVLQMNIALEAPIVLIVPIPGHAMVPARLQVRSAKTVSAYYLSSMLVKYLLGSVAWVLVAPHAISAEQTERMHAACDRVVAAGKIHPKCIEISHAGSCNLLVRQGKTHPSCGGGSRAANNRGPSNKELAERIIGPRPQRQAAAPAPSVSPIQGLNEMPSVERVMQEIKGADPLETAARQSGAFWQLEDMIQILSDGRYFRRQLSADEEEIINSYKSANGTIHREIGKYFPEGSPKSGPDSPSLRWMNRMNHFRSDKTFQSELLDKFFSPAWTNRLQQAKANQDQRIAARKAEETQRIAARKAEETRSMERSQGVSGESSNAQKLMEMLAGYADLKQATEKKGYDAFCAGIKPPRGKGATIRGIYRNVTGAQNDYFYVNKTGAQIDFECGIGMFCGEVVAFLEYEVKGNQILVDRLVLTRTPDGALSGPKEITVTVEREATYGMQPIWERGGIMREQSSTPKSGEGWKQSFEKVQTSPAHKAQERCAIGLLSKTDTLPPKR